MESSKLVPQAGLSALISVMSLGATTACQGDDPGNEVYTSPGNSGSGGGDSSVAGSSGVGATGGSASAGTSSGGGSGTATGGNGGVTGGTGGSSGTGATGGTSAGGTGGAVVNPEDCVGTPVAAETSPADFIWLVDQSGSMSNEAMNIEQNFAGGFWQRLEAAGVRYKIVMVAKADDGNVPVCIPPPVGGAQCGERGNNFFQSNVHIDGDTALLTLISTYDGAVDPWSGELQAHSEKAFIAVSDDDVGSYDDSAFLAAIATLQPAGVFGTVEDPDFVFHSIVGLANEAGPSEPIVSTTCGGLGEVVSAGSAYQRLSIATGGARYPVCNQNYNPAFQQIVDTAVQRTTCRYSLDAAGLAATDRQKLNVTYITGGGTENPLPLAPAGSCEQGWQYNATESKAVLCSQTCADILNDPGGTIRFVTGCESI